VGVNPLTPVSFLAFDPLLVAWYSNPMNSEMMGGAFGDDGNGFDPDDVG